MKLLFKLFILFCTFLGASCVYAATYYVDFVGGSDANTGTAIAAPWKKAPGMAGFTGVYTHQAGDKFIFKGGVTWDHTNFEMDITKSGIAGSPDYYGVDTAWYDPAVCGTSFCRPIFNGDLTHLARGSSIVFIRDQQYVTIDNIEFTGHMAYSNWGLGSISHYCDTNFVMKNLYVHNWQLDKSVATDDAHGGIIGNYPSCRTTGNIISHCVISNNEGRDAGRQTGYAVRNTDIEYSVIHDVFSAQLFGLINNSEIYNVSYPATGHGVVGSNQNFDPALHDNVTYVQGWDGFNLPDLRPGLIYNNIFHDIKVGSGGIYLNTCPSTPFYVFNNLIYNNFGQHDIMIDQYPASSGACGEYHIWNNTFETPALSPIGAIRQVGRGARIFILDTQNNHYIHDNNSDVLLDVGANAWTNGSNVSQTHAQATGGGYMLANKFMPASSLVSTVDKGVSLTFPAAGNLDLLGILRPQGGAWDIGAYEFKIPKNIYIAQTAQGADAGIDCANAHAAAWFNTYGNWGLTGSGKITPGTTVHLCGNISTALTVQGSGMAGNPITIYFEPDAKMSAPYWPSAWQGGGAITVMQKDYITIDGGVNGVIEATANGTASANQQRSVGVGGVVASNFIVKNLTISNMYVRTSDTDEKADGAGIMNTCTLAPYGFHDFSATNNVIHDAYVGITMDYGTVSNVDISHNTIYNVNWGGNIGDRGTGSLATNISVHDNHIYNFANWNDTVGNWYHHNGFYGWAESGGALNDAYFYNNTIGPGFGGAYQTSGVFFSGHVSNIYIFNNLFTAASDEYVANGLVTGGNFVFNNTFIGGGVGIAVNSNGLVENNLIEKGTAIADLYQTSAFFADYNLGYSLRPAEAYALSTTGTSHFYSFAQWQALGQDIHGLNADPKLDVNYQLQAGSPAIGAGTNLAAYCLSVPTLCQDKDGNLRPATGVWDMGAYQFQANLTGDVSNNGRVTMYDAALVLKYTFGGTLTTAQQARADNNGDTTIDAADAAAIAKKALGL